MIVASNAMLISLLLTVVVMLLPPEKSSVSVPTVTVSLEPESALIVSAVSYTHQTLPTLCCV